MAKALDDFANHVRVEVPACPEPMILDALLRTCIDFCTRTEMFSEIIELPTQTDVVSYAIAASSQDMYPARIRNVINGNKKPLDKSDAASYAISTRRKDTGPAETYHAPTRAQLVVEPIPSTGETLEVDVVLRPARAAANVPDVLFDEWLTAIANGAKADLMSKINTPWFNAELSLYYKGLYDDDVATCSVQVAAGNVGAAMRVSPIPL